MADGVSSVPVTGWSYDTAIFLIWMRSGMRLAEVHSYPPLPMYVSGTARSGMVKSVGLRMGVCCTSVVGKRKFGITRP
jgi:hypothetical protein